MNRALVDKLAKAPVFRKIKKKHLEKLSELAIKKEWLARENIYPGNGLLPYVLMLDKGLIHASMLSEKGQSLIILTLKPGELFWGHAVIDGGPTPGTLTAAVDDTVIYMWHKDHLVPILKENSEALWEGMQVLMQRMRRAAMTIDQLAFDDVLTRLAALIVNEYRQAGEIPQFRRSLTLEQMAAMINSNPEVVCRLLYRIDDQGIIDIKRNKFFIKDIERLEQLAKI